MPEIAKSCQPFGLDAGVTRTVKGERIRLSHVWGVPTRAYSLLTLRAAGGRNVAMDGGGEKGQFQHGFRSASVPWPKIINSAERKRLISP